MVTGQPPRLTSTTIAVIEVLAAAKDGDPPLWGTRIGKVTGLHAGTTYPILKRLAAHGWVESWREPDGEYERRAREDSGRPRRIYHRLTGAGRREFGAAMMERAGRPAATGAEPKPRAVPDPADAAWVERLAEVTYLRKRWDGMPAWPPPPTGYTDHAARYREDARQILADLRAAGLVPAPPAASDPIVVS